MALISSVLFWAWDAFCAEFACSSNAHVGFLMVFWLPPVQKLQTIILFQSSLSKCRVSCSILFMIYFLHSCFHSVAVSLSSSRQPFTDFSSIFTADTAVAAGCSSDLTQMSELLKKKYEGLHTICKILQSELLCSLSSRLTKIKPSRFLSDTDGCL